MVRPRSNTVRLQRLARAYRESAALLAAVELGLFTKLNGGANTEVTLSAALGISALNAERLIIACLGLGLIDRDGERLRNAPDVDRFLVEGKSTYAGAWMFFTHPDWAEWGRLAEHLRNPEPARLDNDTVKGITVEEARRYHQATYSIGRGAGRLFLRHVNLSKRHFILDIGGGSGAYCIEACQKHDHLTATVLDLPPVIAVACEFIKNHGLSDRIKALEADFNHDPFPTGADVAIMASNLPMYGRDAVAAVVRKAYASLVPGGEMHLIGEALDESRAGPADPAVWGLAQALNNSTGLAHSVPECVGYLEAAGFRDVSTNDFVPGVLKRISGVRPT